jgi:hypothetical protein
MSRADMESASPRRHTLQAAVFEPEELSACCGMRDDGCEQLGARDSGPNQGGMACGIHTMSSKDVLGGIDSDGDNGGHGLPLPHNE